MILVLIKPDNRIVFATNSMSLEEVESLIEPVKSNSIVVVDYVGAVVIPNLAKSFYWICSGSAVYYSEALRTNECMTLYAQCQCLAKLESVINAKRLKMVKTTQSQDIIYLDKVAEAKTIELMNDPGLQVEPQYFPYTSQYAIVKGIPIKEAAKQILEKHEEQKTMFLDTEHLRLTTLDAIVNINSYEVGMRLLGIIK